jgi:arylsulfatase A-like enzyme
MPALAGLAAVLAVATIAWWTMRRPEPAAPAVPVIIYLVDTLRADRLGLHGHAGETSPRIDALAAESVVFERAYGAAPWTLPSVASLLTSTFACEHGVVKYRRRLNPSVKTLAQRLASLGYATASFYSNAHVGDVAGLNRGYATNTEYLAGDNDRSADVDKFAAEHGSDPFLLYLHTMEPHHWFSTMPRFMRGDTHVSIDERETLRAIWFRHNELRSTDWANDRPIGSTDNTAEQREIMRFLSDHRETITLLYDSAVRHADANVGAVVDVLKRRGLWDRAVFVLLADHGEELGEHGAWFHDQSVYEELVHVPLIVHFPRGEFAGRRVREPVSLLDVVPTLLDYLGRLELCDGCRGTSLMGAIAGATGEPARPAGDAYVPALRMNGTMYFRPIKEARGDTNVVLRRGQWKGIWNEEPDTVELYDLVADGRETDDRSADHPAIAARMREFAREWLDGCRADAAPPEPGEKLDDRSREKLRAMGYFN